MEEGTTENKMERRVPPSHEKYCTEREVDETDRTTWSRNSPLANSQNQLARGR